ncbi:hypothetical protein BaRGS_00012342 [Batillaria attramentaria]|uniref:Uncharacterized protein n=1 Tax=Batillaria attramentaria TaxID=370345 RepID=A0ABD0LB12_9CAEN
MPSRPHSRQTLEPAIHQRDQLVTVELIVFMQGTKVIGSLSVMLIQRLADSPKLPLLKLRPHCPALSSDWSAALCGQCGLAVVDCPELGVLHC